jgi:cysteine desulfurase
MDAAQALATSEIDVAAIGADAVSLSRHKVYGPKGIGALYLRRGLQGAIEPLIVGGGQQDGLRSGTLPVPLCVGLGLAVERMSTPEAKKERQRIASLRDRFAEALLCDGRVALNGPPLASRHPGNCNLRFEGWDAKDLLGRLQPNLAASTGSACRSGTEEPSYVLRAIGLAVVGQLAPVHEGPEHGECDTVLRRIKALVGPASECKSRHGPPWPIRPRGACLQPTYAAPDTAVAEVSGVERAETTNSADVS